MPEVSAEPEAPSGKNGNPESGIRCLRLRVLSHASHVTFGSALYRTVVRPNPTPLYEPDLPIAWFPRAVVAGINLSLRGRVNIICCSSHSHFILTFLQQVDTRK